MTSVSFSACSIWTWQATSWTAAEGWADFPASSALTSAKTVSFGYWKCWYCGCTLGGVYGLCIYTHACTSGGVYVTSGRVYVPCIYTCTCASGGVYVPCICTHACTSGGVYGPCIYTHACTPGGVYVPCIYTHACTPSGVYVPYMYTCMYLWWSLCYLWWSLCTYLQTCQVRVTTANSGLCSCACVTSFKRQWTSWFHGRGSYIYLQYDILGHIFNHEKTKWHVQLWPMVVNCQQKEAGCLELRGSLCSMI